MALRHPAPSGEDVEAAFGEKLSWERQDHPRACRIPAKKPGTIEDPSETQEAVQNWAIDRLLQFKKVVGARPSASATAGPPIMIGRLYRRALFSIRIAADLDQNPS